MKVKTQAYTRMSLPCGNAVTPKKQPRKPHEAFSLPPEILYWCGQKDMNKTVSLKLIVNTYLESYSFPHARKERDSAIRRPEKACETLKCFLSNKRHPSLTGFPCHRNRPRSIASAFRTSFIAPITNILSGGPLAPPMKMSARQDCLMYRIEEPFLPIMRPIFPYGTSTTASTSSCGTSSTAKLSGRNENPPEM
jgi:hypothetical protein